MMTPHEALENVASKFNIVRRDGHRMMAKCPSHEDNRASLSIKIGANSINVKCYAGCDIVNVLSAVGLTMRELYFDQTVRSPHSRMPSQRVASHEETVDSLLRPIFPLRPGEEQPEHLWTDEDIHARLLRLLESYRTMMRENLGNVRLFCAFDRILTLYQCDLWYHDHISNLRLNRKDDSIRHLKDCNPAALRQFAAVGIIQSRMTPKIAYTELLERFFARLEYGIDEYESWKSEEKVVHTYALEENLVFEENENGGDDSSNET